jgi:hypothetical protein
MKPHFNGDTLIDGTAFERETQINLMPRRNRNASQIPPGHNIFQAMDMSISQDITAIYG